MTTAFVHVLHGTPFGTGLTPAASTRLARIATVVDLEAGTAIVDEGRPTAALGVVLRGRLALQLTVPGLGRRTILTIDAGDMFGWSALLDPLVATSTVVVLVPARVLLFERASLVAALADDCEVAVEVHARLLPAVARRLVATRLQLLDVYRPGVEPW